MADASGNPAGMLLSLDIYLTISENTKTSSIETIGSSVQTTLVSLVQITLILHWFSVAADGYYSGRPLGLEYDPQQVQAVPAPPLEAAQPQPRQDVGDQVANHTHVHGVPGVCHTDPNFSCHS